MRIVTDSSGARIAQLVDGQLRLHAADGQLLAAVDLPAGHRLAAFSGGVAVLAGTAAPPHPSLRAATVHRFSWELAPLGAVEVGDVDRRGLSLSADGALLVVTDWRTCAVTVVDANSGAVRGRARSSIPSGASLSPDGTLAISGTADQGSGAILLFEVDRASEGALPMHALPPPASDVGLDDAPYVSAFSPNGARAVIANESWGGRGVFVYDVAARRPLWSAGFPGSSEEPEEWSPPPVTFAHAGTLLLVRGPEIVLAFRVADGALLGELPVAGADDDDGLAADDHGRRVLLPGPQPVAHAWPAAWLAG